MTTIPPLHEMKISVLEPCGRISDVLADAPRLEHHVRALESDRRDLLAALDAVGDRPADKRVAESLSTRLTAYRQRSADVLYEAYVVDIGGET